MPPGVAACALSDYQFLMEYQLNARRLSTAALVLAVGTVPLIAGNAGAATVSTSHAKHLAQAAVLTEKDLAGWTATPDEDNGVTGDDPTDKAFARCIGAAEPKSVAEGVGLDFAKGAREIDSTSAVATSTKAAVAFVAKSTSKKGLACFKKYFVAEGQSEGFAVSHLSVKSAKVNVRGSDHAAALHLTGVITTRQGSVSLDLIDLRALIGPTVIDLTSFGFGTTAPKVSTLEPLARTLVKRVHAA